MKMQADSVRRLSAEEDTKQVALSRGKLLLICVLAILSAAYLGKGLYVGIFVSGGKFLGAVDLHSRWVETRYILRGENPYSIPKENVDLALGSPRGIDYPPW